MGKDLAEIQSLIYEVRGQKVMLDSDLAKLYGVEAKRLNEAVKRNNVRFPADFMFQLTEDEWRLLRSQIATSKIFRGGRRQIAQALNNLIEQPKKTKVIGFNTGE